MDKTKFFTDTITWNDNFVSSTIKPITMKKNTLTYGKRFISIASPSFKRPRRCILTSSDVIIPKEKLYKASLVVRIHNDLVIELVKDRYSLQKESDKAHWKDVQYLTKDQREFLIKLLIVVGHSDDEDTVRKIMLILLRSGYTDSERTIVLSWISSIRDMDKRFFDWFRNLPMRDKLNPLETPNLFSYNINFFFHNWL